MKSITLAIATTLAVAASGTAFAQEGNDRYDHFVPQKTRAEVIAELKQARAAGQVQLTEGETLPHARFVSTLTRAEVRARAAEAVASGELRALGHEGNAIVLTQRKAPSRTVAGE